MPSSSVLDRILSTILDLAESQLEAEGAVAPVLILAGPYGEALVGLDAEDRNATLDKAELMATAFAAEACAWVFETDLWTARGTRRVIVASGEHPGGSAMAMVEIIPDGFCRIATPLDAAACADIPSRLSTLLRDEDAGESVEAWRRLEAMGVTMADARRAIH